jgi:hypothetical protein
MMNGIKRRVNGVRRRFNGWRIRRQIVGKCPECGKVLRRDEHGKRVPPNPLTGSEHLPGVHYKCPNRWGFPSHNEDKQDLREYDIEEVSEEEIEREINRILDR